MMDKKVEKYLVMPVVKNFDSEEYQKIFRKMQQYRRYARSAQAENRQQQAIDEDFYDSIQLTPEDLYVLTERNQNAEIYNIIKPIVNSIQGFERVTRWDYNILPRKKSGSQSAKSKSKVFKYIMDVCRGEFERSEAFSEAVKAGIGWVELGARNTDEIIFMRSERWRNMWYDHLHTRSDGRDMRWVNREKWVDLDVAQAMFPEHAEELELACTSTNSQYPYRPEEAGVTDYASEFDIEEYDFLSGGSDDGYRQRVKLIEMQYRMPAHIQTMTMRDESTPYGTLDGAIYNPSLEDHRYLVANGYFTLTDSYRMVVRHSIFTGKIPLQDVMSPYTHGMFSFVPIFCYRRKRDNMPYGVIRDLRDPQIAYNAKKMRARFIMSARQMVLEKGAVNDIKNFHDELQRPDGIMLVNEGKMNAWREINVQALAQEHLESAREDERSMYSVAMVTADAEWQARKDLSGKALETQERQAQTGQGIIFDNYTHSMQCAGELILSLIEQFIDKEMEFRITGDQNKDEFIKVNQKNEQGEIDTDSSITMQKADFIIGKRDYRESIRQRMSEQFVKIIELVGNIKPEMAVNMLDLIVDLMDDLPNKEEAVARIRKINGQHAPEDEMNDKEKQEIKQIEEKMQQKAAMQEQIQQAMIQVKLAVEQSKAQKNLADASVKKLEGFIKALEAAGILTVAPRLVQAADTLVNEAQLIGQQQGNGNGQQQGQQQQIQGGQ